MANTNTNQGWTTEAQVAEERGFYSDLYKDEMGFRPRSHTNAELAAYMNANYKLVGNQIVLIDLKVG